MPDPKPARREGGSSTSSEPCPPRSPARGPTALLAMAGAGISNPEREVSTLTSWRGHAFTPVGAPLRLVIGWFTSFGYFHDDDNRRAFRVSPPGAAPAREVPAPRLFHCNSASRKLKERNDSNCWYRALWLERGDLQIGSCWAGPLTIPLVKLTYTTLAGIRHGTLRWDVISRCADGPHWNRRIRSVPFGLAK